MSATKKTNKNVGVDCTDHVIDHERTFEDNRFPDRFLELLFVVCEEQGVTLKQIIEGGVKFLTQVGFKFVEETSQENESVDVINKAPKDVINKEVAPAKIDEEPSMAQIGLCGFNRTLTNMAFSPLVKSKIFEKWMYRIIKTIPYCYPMRHKNTGLEMSGNNDHRLNVLATTVLGLLWNNNVTFGEKFPKKKAGDAPEKIPMFMDDVLEQVKEVIKERARIVRSNLCRPTPTKKRLFQEASVTAEVVQEVVVEQQEEVISKPRRKRGSAKSSKKLRVTDESAI